MLLSIVGTVGLVFFYALFVVAYASPIFFFFVFVVFRNSKNVKRSFILSAVFALVVLAAVLYLTKDAPAGDDEPLRYGQYPWLIGF